MKRILLDRASSGIVFRIVRKGGRNGKELLPGSVVLTVRSTCTEVLVKPDEAVGAVDRMHSSGGYCLRTDEDSAETDCRALRGLEAGAGALDAGCVDGLPPPLAARAALKAAAPRTTPCFAPIASRWAGIRKSLTVARARPLTRRWRAHARREGRRPPTESPADFPPRPLRQHHLWMTPPFGLHQVPEGTQARTDRYRPSRLDGETIPAHRCPAADLPPITLEH